MTKQTQFIMRILIFSLYSVNILAQEYSNLECNTTSKFTNILQGKFKNLKNIHQETKVLMIVVDFQTDKVEENEQFFSNIIHNPDDNVEGFHKFWNRVTYGQKSIKHAEENWNTQNDGVIRVTLPYNLEHNGNFVISSPQPVLMYEIIEKASAYIDFSIFDINGDTIITKEELVIGFHFPYRFRSFASSGLGSESYNGMNLDMSTMALSRDATFSTNLHESGHALYSLHDIYGDYNAWREEKVDGLMRILSSKVLSAYSQELLNLRVGREENNDEMRLVEQDAPASEEGFRLYKVLSDDPEEYFLFKNINGKLEITQRSPHYAKQIFYEAARKNTSSHDLQYVSGVSANTSVTNVLNTGNIMTFDIEREVRTLAPTEMINPLFQRISSKKLDYFRWADVGAEKYGLKVVFSFPNGHEEIVYHNMDIQDSFIKFDYDSSNSNNLELRQLTATVTLSTFIDNKWEEEIYYYAKKSKENLLSPTSLLVRVADERDDCSLELTWKDNAQTETGYIITHNDSTIDTIPADSESYILFLPKDGDDDKCKNTSVGVRAIGLKGLVSERIEKYLNLYTTAPDIKSRIIFPLDGSRVIPGETVTVMWNNYGAVRKKFKVSVMVNDSYVVIHEDRNIQGISTSFEMPLVFEHAYVSLFSYNSNNEQIGYSQIFLRLNNDGDTPQAVINLQASNITSSSATLTWAHSGTNITGYKIYNGTTEVETIDANVTSYVLTQLTADTNYTYGVKAFKGTVESNLTSVSFKTLENVVVTKSVLTHPTSTSILIVGETVNVQWENHGASRVYLYVRYYLNGEYTVISSGYVTDTSKSMIIPAEIADHNVDFFLFSYNDQSRLFGTSKVTLEAKSTILDTIQAVTNLQAINITKTTATFSWTHRDTNTTGYNIYEGTEKIGTMDANARNYNLRQLTPNTKYIYGVTAVRGTVESNLTTVNFKTLKAKSLITSPQTATKVEGGESVTVEWGNYGANRQKFYAAAIVNGQYVNLKEDLNIQGISTTFEMPLRFTLAYAYIISYDINNMMLGSSLIMLYPQE